MIGQYSRAKLRLNQPSQPRENPIKRPHLTALLCFIIAGLLYFALPSKEYGIAFLLLGLLFDLIGWKAMLSRKPK